MSFLFRFVSEKKAPDRNGLHHLDQGHNFLVAEVRELGREDHTSHVAVRKHFYPDLPLSLSAKELHPTLVNLGSSFNHLGNPVGKDSLFVAQGREHLKARFNTLK